MLNNYRLLLLLLVCLPGVGHAAATENAVACAGLADDSARLACYDALFRNKPSGAMPTAETSPVEANAPSDAIPTAETSPIETNVPSGAISTAETSSVEAAAPAAAIPTAETSPVAATDSSPDNAAATSPAESAAQTEKTAAFGADDLDQHSEDTDELRELTATVVAIQSLRSKARRIELDNGQVWQEKRFKRGVRLAPGDTIRIKAGTLGLHKLFGKGKVSTAVDRVR